MGQYIYKVTAKTKMLDDGTKANIAIFAYKPCFDVQVNRFMEWKTKCHISDKFVKTSKNYTGKVVLGEDGNIAIPVNSGTFSDDWFDLQIEKMNKE
jgi:hypothetical protein